MMLLLLPTVLAIIATSEAVTINNTLLDGKIVGGRLTHIEEYPYQVSVQYWRVHFCGGSLLTPVRVLTAAHCAVKYDIRTLNVYGGSSSLYQYYGNGQSSKVIRGWVHPKFDTKTLDYDVAVLAVARRFIYNAAMQPISLQPRNTEIRPRTMCSVTGWGALKYKSDTSIQLRTVQMPVMNINDCRYMYHNEYISDRMFCLGYRRGRKDSCQGDSGGAIVCGGKQVGIVSWGIGCAAPNKPSVVTKISNVEINAFIKSHLR